MPTFKQVRDRITADLRRSNLVEQIKNGINDALLEAAQTNFGFNEMEINVATSNGARLIDQVWQEGLLIYGVTGAYRRITSTQVERLELMNDLDIQELQGNSERFGIPEAFSFFSGKLRLYPIPDGVYDIFLIGHGTETYPLVNDNDTNDFLKLGELYIRWLAKRNVLRDVIRDYGEAQIAESVAEDHKAQLLEAASQLGDTGSIRGTRF